MKNLAKIALLLVAFTLVYVVQPVDAQTIKDRFAGIFVEHDADIDGDLDVDGTANLDVVDIDGAVDFGGQELDLDSDNDTSITADTDDQIDFEVAGADELRITTTGPALVEQTVVVVTAGSIITPTGAYQPITSTAEFTASASTAVADGTVVGQLLILVNENASDVIHIPDAANTNISAQADLGNDDTITLIWDGADWLEVAQVDN